MGMLRRLGAGDSSGSKSDRLQAIIYQRTIYRGPSIEDYATKPAVVTQRTEI